MESYTFGNCTVDGRDGFHAWHIPGFSCLDFGELSRALPSFSPFGTGRTPGLLFGGRRGLSICADQIPVSTSLRARIAHDDPGRFLLTNADRRRIGVTAELADRPSSE
jgi:hypothetical protein